MFSLRPYGFFVLFSQFCSDSDTSDKDTLLRVRGALAFKCQVDSTDGGFTDLDQPLLRQFILMFS